MQNQSSQEYKIVSLGNNCFPRRILTESGIKPSKEEGECSLPFDLAVNPIESVIQLLNNNFNDYFDDLYFDENIYLWKNSKYNIVYNHDKDCGYDDKQKLVTRYKNRINNFRNLIAKDTNFLYFVISSIDTINQRLIDKLYKTLEIICNRNKFKLVILDFFSSNIKEHDNIKIISTKQPYKDFAKSWWNDKYRYTKDAKNFEQIVVDKFKDVISENYNLIKYKGIDDTFRKKQIFINFADFPNFLNSRRFSPYSNMFTDVLSKYYNVIISDKPDFLFYSVFGNNNEKYKNCVRIFYTCEVIAPNFNECDYAIGFDDISFDDRYLRYPMYYDELTPDNIRNDNIDETYANRKFCNFIYSNDFCGEGALLRKEFCQKLMEYKHVDCPGKVLNNMSDAIGPRVGDFAKAKLEFQKGYKFTIAFENNCYNGYSTEKLSQAFLAHTIPIYWGNPDVSKDFNEKAFINCSDYKTFEDVIEKIKELDNNNEKYLEMLKQTCVSEKFVFNKKELFEEFILNIAKKGNKPFNKNPNPVINKYGYVEINPTKTNQSKNKHLDNLFSIKNEYTNSQKRKIITILGIKIKLKINSKK